MSRDAMHKTVSPSTLEFLQWISSRPRTYAETMEAWRTTCPRQSVWEDALSDGLIQLESTTSQFKVNLTARGRAALGARLDHPRP